MDIKGNRIEFLGHAGFLIETGNKKIVIDPYNVSRNVSKADIVLITHRHHDHCSIKDIEKVSDKGTVVMCPADCQSKIMKIEGVNIQIVEPGDVLDFRNLKIEAFPAYNKITDHHPKSEGWLGYLVKSDNFVVYHAGDTDYIPEMNRLSGYGKKDNDFIALLPVAGNVVMDADEAVDVAAIINANLSIPMSYGSGVYGSLEDANHFVSLCKERNINARILDKI